MNQSIMLVKNDTQYQNAISRAKLEAALEAQPFRHPGEAQQGDDEPDESCARKEDLDEEESPTGGEYQPKGYLRVLRDKLKEEI